MVLGQADVHVYKAYTQVGLTQTGEVDEVFAPGSLLTSDTIATIGASDADGFDGQDTLRVTLAVENRGSAATGAFDVQLKDSLDDSLSVADPTSLTLHRGDGTAITEVELLSGGSWQLTSVAGNQAAILAALHGSAGIRFVDDGGPALARGQSGAGEPTADGSNIIYLSYLARVDADIEPGSTNTSEASLLGFANAENAGNFLASLREGEIVVTPRVDDATIDYRGNAVGLLITATPGHDDTTVPTPAGSADAVIGEYIDYRLTLSLAEATTVNGIVTVNLGADLGLVNVAGVSAPGTISVGHAGFGTSGSAIGSTAIDADSGTASVQLASISANAFSISLGDVVNAQNDAGDETITVEFRAIPLNTTANQEGSTGADRTVTASFTAAENNDTATVTIREPQLTASLTASATTVSADNEVEYTLRVTNGSVWTAHDVVIDEVLASIADQYLGDLVQSAAPAITGSGTPGTIGGAGVGANSLAFTISALAPGQAFEVKFKSTVSGATPFGTQLVIDPDVTWTSLPGGATDISPLVSGVTDSERTGAGGVINDYRRTPTATVTFAVPGPGLVIDATSEGSTSGPSDPASTNDDTASADAAIGEVVRLRMVVQLPESTSTDLTIVPTLPAGLSYQGNATIALLSNDEASPGASGVGIRSSTLDADGTGGAQAAGNDPALVNPTHAIVADTTNPLKPVFSLGNVDNTDRDADQEWVIIEFDAVVANVPGNQQDSALSVSYEVASEGGLPATSSSITLNVVEPTLSLDKRVSGVSYASVDPAVDGEAVVTYTVTLTNTSGATAHDVALSDLLPSGSSIVSPPSATSSGSVGDLVDNSGGGAPAFSIASLAPGASVTVSYSVTLPDRDSPPAATEALATWTSVSGTSTEERTGADGLPGAGILNDYQARNDAGLGMISGTLWDDTLTPNGAIDTGEARLPGVTVTLTWFGADGSAGGGDDLVLQTVTAADGSYRFGALPIGNYRISAPDVNATITAGDPDTLRARWDADGAGNGLGTLELSLTEGQASSGRNVGYVQENDPPVNTVPSGTLTVDEDTALAITGISIADPDGDLGDGLLQVRLVVANGSLRLAGVAGDGSADGVTVAGTGTGTLVLTGSQADLNTALAKLQYTGNQDWSGNDTLTITTNDRGQGGDGDGDGTPRES
ncbi:MAG: SdrD B-like domain-containing protein, partial [Burkholderiaceae bacterium]